MNYIKIYVIIYIIEKYERGEDSVIGIYMYENKINHKKYIGQSNNIERRRKEHLNYPSPYSKFDNYLSKLGEEQFNFIILEECETSQLAERERYWISYYNTIEEGYNIINGGQTFLGDANPFSKLSDKEVKEIIKLLETTKYNNQQIADKYKVHRNTIDNINRCKNWTHLHSYKTNIRQENLNKLEYKHSSFAGENSSSSKLTENCVINIIKLLEKDKRSIAQLAKDLNINLNILYDINRCKTWKYLHNYNKNIRNEYKKKGCDVLNEDE